LRGQFRPARGGQFDRNFQFDKQIRIPTEPLYKKTMNYNSRFYNFATWAFRVKSDSTIYDLGSSQVEYDSTLSNFKIKYFKPFEIQNTHPIILASPIFMDNGKLITGGMFPGIRSEIAYPMAFVKYDKDLNRVDYHDMKHIRKGDGYGVEAVEYLKKIDEEKFIAIVNYEPRNDYFRTGNNDVEFYIVDTNFNELKKMTYGDTANYKYHFKDAINTFDGHLLVLMHHYKNDYDIAYELAKFDKNLNLVTGKVPTKRYDFKCKTRVDTFNLINLNNFDTVQMENWKSIAQPTQIKLIFNGENGLSLYPNPSNGTVFVKLDEQETGRLKVYNSIGQLVFEQAFIKSDNFEVKLPSNLEGYLYFKIESTSINVVKVLFNL
ncbi:MAG: T9SS type A sorting domain-containing protein, partial [bacterium]|nr:T9SS type A sorting domain-containing protein [bacterium]